MTVNYGPFNDVNNGQTYISIPQPCVTGNEPYCDDGATGTYPICNHVIVLLDCDIEKDQYKFWTWANELTLPKEVLVANETTGIGGSLCSFMVGKPSGGNQPPFEPTPCETGVCNLFCSISDASGTGSAATNTDAEGTDAMGSSSTATEPPPCRMLVTTPMRPSGKLKQKLLGQRMAPRTHLRAQKLFVVAMPLLSLLASLRRVFCSV